MMKFVIKTMIKYDDDYDVEFALFNIYLIVIPSIKHICRYIRQMYDYFNTISQLLFTRRITSTLCRLEVFDFPFTIVRLYVYPLLEHATWNPNKYLQFSTDCRTPHRFLQLRTTTFSFDDIVPIFRPSYTVII